MLGLTLNAICTINSRLKKADRIQGHGTGDLTFFVIISS